MWLFLAALGMLFTSSMLLYVLMRVHFFGSVSDEPIHLPPAIWASTFVLILASVAIQRAVANVRIERLANCEKYLHITTVLAVLFLAIQFPCLWKILEIHRDMEARIIASQPPGTQVHIPLYGLVFVLILLHALHIIGGIIALGIVSVRAHRRAYDHENYGGVQFTARYWHFLDIVWLGMFTTFLVLP
jgi:cytochrome c oxidase subunit III